MGERELRSPTEGGAIGGPLFKQIGLFARDAVPERLELEPAGQGRAQQRVGMLGGLVRDFVRLAGGFRQQLRVAGAVHGDEPPDGLINASAHGEQAVIAQDGGLLVAERAGDAVAFAGFLDDAGVIVEHRVVFVKRAGILREGIKRAAQRRPRFAVQRMGVRRGDHVRAGFVDARVDGKRRQVDFAPALLIRFRVVVHDFPLVIDQDEVGNANLAEMHPKGVHPEMIEPLGIARGDVAGPAFVKAIAREEAEGRGEALLAVAPLFGKRGKDGRAGNAIEQRPWLRRLYLLRFCFGHKNLPADSGSLYSNRSGCGESFLRRGTGTRAKRETPRLRRGVWNGARSEPGKK